MIYYIQAYFCLYSFNLSLQINTLGLIKIIINFINKNLVTTRIYILSINN